MIVGDPDLGDGAGNCNLTRKAAAERWSIGWHPTRLAAAAAIS